MALKLKSAGYWIIKWQYMAKEIFVELQRFNIVDIICYNKFIISYFYVLFYL